MEKQQWANVVIVKLVGGGWVRVLVTKACVQESPMEATRGIQN